MKKDIFVVKIAVFYNPIKKKSITLYGQLITPSNEKFPVDFNNINEL